MVSAREIPVVDINSFVYEPQKIWDTYLPTEYQGIARTALWHQIDDAGNVITVLNGEPAPPLNGTKIVRQAIWRPGLTIEEIGQLDPDTFHALNPGASEPEARLKDMDAVGVDQALLFPTIFSEYFPLVRDPVAAGALAQAYNDWIWDFAQAAPERLHPMAVLPLQSISLALGELKRVEERGFKGVVLRPMLYQAHVTRSRNPMAQMRNAMLRAGAQGGPSLLAGLAREAREKGRGEWIYLDDDHFQPVWKALAESDLVACVHPALGIANPEPVSEASFIERVAANLNIGHPVSEVVAPMQDNLTFLTAILFHGLLEDLPDLKLALVGANGASLPLALEKAETYLWLGGQTAITEVSLNTERVWEDARSILGFEGWETPIGEMVDIFGEKANWGSRYPYHDTTTPDETIQMLEASGVEAEQIQRYLGGNAAKLFGLKLSAPA